MKLTKGDLNSIIAHLVRRRWTKWTLIFIYNYSTTNRSIEVRQHLKSGKLQFRVKKIADPVRAQYFDAEDVKKALNDNTKL